MSRGHCRPAVCFISAGLLATSLASLPAPASAIAGSSAFTQPTGVFLGDEGHNVTSTGTVTFGPGGGAASLYPSVVSLPHFARIVDVDVDVEIIRHTNPDDIALLLVQDGGPQVTLMANAGGSTDLDPVSGTSLFFDDEAPQALPDEAPLTTGTYRPAAYGTLSQLPPPAPAVTGNTSLSVLDGLPVGADWSLFAFDDDGSDFTGSFFQWRLRITYETTPYPSELSVAGAGTVQDVDVTLHRFTSGSPQDVELLLVGPSGQQATLMSDAGGTSEPADIELTFDDEAAGDVPASSFGDPLVSGTYRPTNIDDDHGPDVYPAPAPGTTGAASLAAFDGTDPNGTWRLFAVDDDNFFLTSIEGGWSLDIDWDDSTAPTGSISVAGGAPTATTSAVTLQVSAADPAPATGVEHMRFSNDGQTWSPFQPYAATASWTLGSGDGTKTVHAQLRDRAGNVSTVVSDTIVLDTTPPRAKKLKPRRNARDVPPRATVRVVATEALDPASLTRAVVLRHRGAKVKASVSYVASRHAIRLVPAKGLAPGTYKVKVKTRVTDVAGNRFDAKRRPGLQPLVWTFEVG